MPSPSTIVTFTDADGDEFPVRLPLPPAEAEDLWARGVEARAAEMELEEHIEQGICSPTMPVTITKVEEV